MLISQSDILKIYILIILQARRSPTSESDREYVYVNLAQSMFVRRGTDKCPTHTLSHGPFETICTRGR